MSWLDPMEPDDALSQLLTDWRGELDSHVGAVMSTELPVVPGRSRRWLRAHQRTAAATAIVVAIAGSTSVAAAATGSSGPLGPVHDLLYGKPAPPPIDYAAIQVRHILGVVAQDIAQARQAGSIEPAERDRLSGQLDDAQHLLDGDTDAPVALDDRVTELRAELDAIPTAASRAPASHHRGHGRDDGSGGTQPSTSGPSTSEPGTSGEDNQGSDDGQGDDRSGSQSSDDGSHSSDDGDGSTSGGDQTDSSGGEDGSGSGGGDQIDDGSSSGDQSDDGGSVSSDGGDSGGSEPSQAGED